MAGPDQEGTIPFATPSLDIPCQTYYKVFGTLQSGCNPLVVLHGGPGSAHEYMLTFQKLWSIYGIPVIFYDQIGCGGSTHLRHKAGDQSFWQLELFISELENLLEYFGLGRNNTYDILGHSFGGILGATFASHRPVGLRRLVLAGPPASAELFQQGAWKMLKQLSTNAQKAVEEAVKTREYTTQAYIEAASEFARTFWSRADPWPGEALKMNLKHQADDTTVRRSLLGPCLWAWEGTLANWTCVPILHQIDVPTLIYNGEFDTAQYEATVPFFENIPKVRWVTLPSASHMHHLDSPELEEKVLSLVHGFVQFKEA